MVSLPTSPEGPTVYAIVSRQSDPALHALTEAGVAALGSAVRQREAAGLKLSDGSDYREERRVAMMETMFGADAGDDDLTKLRTAVRNLDA